MSTASIEKNENTQAGFGAERHIVALQLGDETYGVDIACIHTVLTPQEITSVPNVPCYVKGVMNLRGKILPVLDLRARFRMPELPSEKAKSSRIMIVEADGLTAGLVVDSVSEVLRLPAGSIEPPSSLLGSNDLRCLTGIGRVPKAGGESGKAAKESRLLLLLDIPQILSLVSIDAASETAIAA
jgi:purine-binding chemotaxis protein CheW